MNGYVVVECPMCGNDISIPVGGYFAVCLRMRDAGGEAVKP